MAQNNGNILFFMEKNAALKNKKSLSYRLDFLKDNT